MYRLPISSNRKGDLRGLGPQFGYSSLVRPFDSSSEEVRAEKDDAASAQQACGRPPLSLGTFKKKREFMWVSCVHVIIMQIHSLFLLSRGSLRDQVFWMQAFTNSLIDGYMRKKKRKVKGLRFSIMISNGQIDLGGVDIQNSLVILMLKADARPSYYQCIIYVLDRTIVNVNCSRETVGLNRSGRSDPWTSAPAFF